MTPKDPLRINARDLKMGLILIFKTCVHLGQPKTRRKELLAKKEKEDESLKIPLKILRRVGVYFLKELLKSLE